MAATKQSLFSSQLPRARNGIGAQRSSSYDSNSSRGDDAELDLGSSLDTELVGVDPSEAKETFSEPDQGSSSSDGDGTIDQNDEDTDQHRSILRSADLSDNFKARQVGRRVRTRHRAKTHTKSTSLTARCKCPSLCSKLSWLTVFGIDGTDEKKLGLKAKDIHTGRLKQTWYSSLRGLGWIYRVLSQVTIFMILSDLFLRGVQASVWTSDQFTSETLELIVALEHLDAQLAETLLLLTLSVMGSQRFIFWISRGGRHRLWAAVPFLLALSPFSFFFLSLEEMRWQSTLQTVLPVLQNPAWAILYGFVLICNSLALAAFYNGLSY